MDSPLHRGGIEKLSNLQRVTQPLDGWAGSALGSLAPSYTLTPAESASAVSLHLTVLTPETLPLPINQALAHL